MGPSLRLPKEAFSHLQLNVRNCTWDRELETVIFYRENVLRTEIAPIALQFIANTIIQRNKLQQLVRIFSLLSGYDFICPTPSTQNQIFEGENADGLVAQ